jgi:hypothetical protein
LGVVQVKLVLRQQEVPADIEGCKECGKNKPVDEEKEPIIKNESG